MLEKVFSSCEANLIPFNIWHAFTNRHNFLATCKYQHFLTSSFSNYPPFPTVRKVFVSHTIPQFYRALICQQQSSSSCPWLFISRNVFLGFHSDAICKNFITISIFSFVVWNSTFYINCFVSFFFFFFFFFRCLWTQNKAKEEQEVTENQNATEIPWRCTKVKYCLYRFACQNRLVSGWECPHIVFIVWVVNLTLICEKLVFETN